MSIDRREMLNAIRYMARYGADQPGMRASAAAT